MTDATAIETAETAEALDARHVAVDIGHIHEAFPRHVLGRHVTTSRIAVDGPTTQTQPIVWQEDPIRLDDLNIVGHTAGMRLEHRVQGAVTHRLEEELDELVNKIVEEVREDIYSAVVMKIRNAIS